MGDVIRVLLIDDEPKLRASWEKLLAKAPDLECAGVLANTDNIAETINDKGAQVVLLDLILPGHDPVKALARIKESCPECRVIIYSAYADEETTRHVMDAGAWGFVDKMTPIADVLDAIRDVAKGCVVLPNMPTVVSRPAAQPNARKPE